MKNRNSDLPACSSALICNFSEFILYLFKQNIYIQLPLSEINLRRMGCKIDCSIHAVHTSEYAVSHNCGKEQKVNIFAMWVQKECFFPIGQYFASVFKKMHSFWGRANMVAAYTLNVLACLTFFCFLSSLSIDYHMVVKLNAVKLLCKLNSQIQNPVGVR